MLARVSKVTPSKKNSGSANAVSASAARIESDPSLHVHTADLPTTRRPTHVTGHPELSMGWVDPWVGLGWVGSRFFSFWWVGLGWVHYYFVF